MSQALKQNADWNSLIAIMLGRLEMTVAECIVAYTDMFKRIFETQKHKIPVKIRGKTADLQGRFDLKILENSIKEIVKSRELSEADLLNTGDVRACRV